MNMILQKPRRFDSKSPGFCMAITGHSMTSMKTTVKQVIKPSNTALSVRNCRPGWNHRPFYSRDEGASFLCIMLSLTVQMRPRAAAGQGLSGGGRTGHGLWRMKEDTPKLGCPLFIYYACGGRHWASCCTPGGIVCRNMHCRKNRIDS